MSVNGKSIAIIGASNNTSKYSYAAVRAYMDQGYKVFPVNPNQKEVAGLKTYPSVSDIEEQVDLASMYLPPKRTYDVLEGIAQKEIKDVYFNPGSADDKVITKAKELGINPIEACSIVAIGKSPGQYMD